VLVPRLELKRVFLQNRLVPDFDPGLMLDYESPVEEDATHRLATMVAAFWAFTADEWREEAGYAELPDGAGKVHAVPFSFLFVDQLGGDGDNGGAPPSEEPPKSKRLLLEAPKSGTAASPAAIPKLPPVAEQIIAEVLDAIESDTLDDAIRPILQDAVLGFGAATLDDLLPGVSFDLNDPAVVDFLRNGRKAEIVDANEVTQAAIRDTLADGYEAGENMAALQSRVEAVFDDAVGRRSHVIARTETVSSANFGAFQAIEQSGLSYKSWLAVRDDATRDTHLALDSQPPIPLDQEFISESGAAAMHPGDFGVAEEDIQCRCSILGEAAPAEGESPRTRLESEEQRAAAWRSFEGARTPYEKQMKRSVKAAFRKQEKAAKAAVREAT